MEKATNDMFSWLGTDDRRRKEPEVFQTVSDGLKKLYKTKLLPLEENYKFHEFHSPALEDADFDNKPMVLLVGQYSTGKTSFIRWGGKQTMHANRLMHKESVIRGRERKLANTPRLSATLTQKVRKPQSSCTQLHSTRNHTSKLYWNHKCLLDSLHRTHAELKCVFLCGLY